MSAWLCSQYHIAAIATALGDLGHCPERMGEMLLRENAASLRYRYGDADDIWGPEIFLPYAHRDVRVSDACLVVQTVCYAYQACEHPGWDGSMAHRLNETAQTAALKRLGTTLDAFKDSAEWRKHPWGLDAPPATEVVDLAGESAEQALIPGVEAISQTTRAVTRETVQRELRRRDLGARAPDFGPLFDEVFRQQQDLLS